MSIPNEDKEGYIEDQQSKKVFGIQGENWVGSKVVFQTKENPENPDQKWKRSATDEQGFFTLKNLKSGLFLNDAGDVVNATIESISLFLNELN